MVTPYNAIFVDKDDVSLSEYALKCAAVKNLDEIKPNSFHKKQLAEVKKRLNNFNSMADDKARELAHEDYISELKKYGEYTENKRKIAVKTGNMLVKVTKWKAPTADHEDLRDLMIDQLKKGLSDCDNI